MKNAWPDVAQSVAVGHMRCGAVRLEARSWKTVVNNKNTRRVRKGKKRAAVADDAHEVVVEAGIRLFPEREQTGHATPLVVLENTGRANVTTLHRLYEQRLEHDTSMSYQSRRRRLRIAQMCTHWFADHLQ